MPTVGKVTAEYNFFEILIYGLPQNPTSSSHAAKALKLEKTCRGVLHSDLVLSRNATVDPPTCAG